MTDPSTTIAFQGAPGAYSNLACQTAFPDWTPLPCGSFEEAFRAVEDGRAALGMIPIENSLAGRVADIHHLLPGTGLHIVGEHFQRVQHQLLVPKGATIPDPGPTVTPTPIGPPSSPAPGSSPTPSASGTGGAR